MKSQSKHKYRINNSRMKVRSSADLLIDQYASNERRVQA
jgi:hypothetical protein